MTLEVNFSGVNRGLCSVYVCVCVCFQILARPSFPTDTNISTRKDGEFVSSQTACCSTYCASAHKSYMLVENLGAANLELLPPLAFLGFFLKDECSWLLLTEYLHQTPPPPTPLLSLLLPLATLTLSICFQH